MKSFVIFAIVVTIIYVIYYTVIIVQDLYGKPKDEKSQGESFDVSDMTDEEESIAVSESDGGFSVGDNQYETAYEEKQLAEPTEEAAATAEESKPHVLEEDGGSEYHLFRPHVFGRIEQHHHRPRSSSQWT